MGTKREDRKREKKKKKGRFWHYLYAFVILVMTIANISLAALLLTYVQNTELKGTKYSEPGKILAWFQKDPFTKNSVYSYWKVKSGAYQLPNYLEEMDISFNAPWDICVEVKEKEVVAGIDLGGRYVYFDREGLVMTIAAEPLEEIILVEGICSENLFEAATLEVEQFQMLEADDERIFNIIYDFILALQKQKLTPETIVWEDGSMNLMFGEINVQLGKNHFEEKLAQLPPILEGSELEGKAGILHMENYTSAGDSITFKPNTENAVNTETEE